MWIRWSPFFLSEEFDVSRDTQTLKFFQEHLLELRVNVVVDVQGNLNVSTTTLPGPVLLKDGIWLEELHVARPIEHSVKEARAAGVPEVCGSPVEA